MTLWIREIGAQDAAMVSALFAEIASDEAARRFHPHPFTQDAAVSRCEYSGRDVFAVAGNGHRPLCYGMLRGWDEGYSIPSLGICVVAAARGTGIARLMMHYLHSSARIRGASEVRLKVYPDNVAAVRIYKSMGYHFAEKLEADQLVGHVSL